MVTWHNEKMAGRDRMQRHEDHNGLVLVHHAGLGSLSNDGAEDALVGRHYLVLCHARDGPSVSGPVLLS